MPLNLPQLLKKTPRSRFLSANYVRLTRIKMGYDKDGKAIAYCQSHSTHRIDAEGNITRNTNPYSYVTYVRFIDDKLNVEASCSCEDFCFRWEVVLHSKGAAEIEFSNGAPPTVTNPAYRVGACKHLIKLLQKIKDKVPTPEPQSRKRK